MISAIRTLPHENRLKKCKLMTLKNRRLRADLIEVYKIMSSFTDSPAERLFNLNTYPRPGRHKYTLIRGHSRLDVRHKFFSQRVIPYWNALPTEAVEASSINDFKGHIEKLVITWGALHEPAGSMLHIPLSGTLSGTLHAFKNSRVWTDTHTHTHTQPH